MASIRKTKKFLKRISQYREGYYHIVLKDKDFITGAHLFTGITAGNDVLTFNKFGVTVSSYFCVPYEHIPYRRINSIEDIRLPW